MEKMTNCISNRRFANLLFVNVRIGDASGKESFHAGNNTGMIRELYTTVILSIQIGNVHTDECKILVTDDADFSISDESGSVFPAEMLLSWDVISRYRWSYSVKKRTLSIRDCMDCGLLRSASAVFCILQSIILFTFILKNNLMKKYGLCKFPVPAWRFLYYVPLIVLASGKLWNGAAISYTPMDTACQIVFTIAVGFLLVTIFYRGGSLILYILVHSTINTFSTFANDANLTTEMYLIHLGILIVVTVVYTLFLTKTLPKSQWRLPNNNYTFLGEAYDESIQ